MWIAWREELPLLKEFAVPRCVFSKVSNKLETTDLHIFADASPIAFGMVAYVKSINEDNDVNVRLLCSKNRVAPMRTRNTPELTLPKLELTAILLAAKHLSYFRKNLTIKFSATYIWSDSKIALHLVANPYKKCESYIKNRVREITELTSDVVWKHCPGEHNPADLLTRGVKVRQLLTSDRWLHGPDWLSQVTQHCFSTNEFPDNVISSLVTTETNKSRKTITNVRELTQLEKYSNLGKLLRITAYVLRFGQILRKKVMIASEVLTTAEIEKAENLWVRIVQQSFYSNELFCLVKGQQLPISSKIATLNLFLDDEGLIRVGGRLQFAEGNLSFKHPIILPKESAFSRLVILYFHERAFHGGVVATLTLIRQRYWVIHARQVTKSIINRCTVCRWLRAHPLSQPFAPLPKDRIVVSRPFEVTGLDFAGPLFIKEEITQKKVYILLFTCASIRAVHLELVPDLSTEACIRAIRRFISRRGVPRRFYSDNAKTFKRASVEFKELSHFVESRSLNEFVLKQRTEWRFIVERAAWWGGWWVRLIRSVKDALKATIRRSILNFDQLQTLLVEIEFIVNSRPLTYLSPDPNDPEPLSPAHFLFNAMPNVLPIADKKDLTSMNTDIVKMWKQRQGLLSKFWKQWTTDYLQQLRSAHHMPKKFSSTISRGDVVLISEQSTPRLLWKIAVVETTYPGRDGKVRACELRLPNGHKLRRPIQYLYPLEISGESSPQAAGEDVKK